jgi:hypothetical protein
METNTRGHNGWKLPLVMGALGAISASITFVPLSWDLSELELPEVIYSLVFALAMALGVSIGWPRSEVTRPNLPLFFAGIASLRWQAFSLFRLSTFLFGVPTFLDPTFLNSVMSLRAATMALQAVLVLLGASFAVPKLARPTFIGTIGACGALIGFIGDYFVWNPHLPIVLYSVLVPLVDHFVPDMVFGAVLGYFLLRVSTATSSPQLSTPEQRHRESESIAGEQPASSLTGPPSALAAAARTGLRQLEDAAKVQLRSVEMRVQSASFLREFWSSLTAYTFTLGLVLIIFAPARIESPQMFLFIFLAALLSTFSVVRLWRPVIALVSLIFGLFFVAYPLIWFSNSLDLMARAVPDDPVFQELGTLLAALFTSPLMLIGWRILADGMRVATTNRNHRGLLTTVEPGLRGFLKSISACFGIHPICAWIAQIWRRLVAIGLFVLSSLVGGAITFCVIVLIVTGMMYPVLFSDVAVVVGGLFAAGVTITAMLRNIARRFARLSVEELSQVDKRAPILFLRSFHDDQVKLKRPRMGPIRWLLAAGEPMPVLDHILLEELTPIGPLVAIGLPGSPPPFGAARTYHNDNEWQNAVVRLTKSARLIVLVVDDTPGVNWELVHIDSSGYRSKTVYLLPPRLTPRIEAARVLQRELLNAKTSDLADWLPEPCIGWHQKADGKVSVFTSPRPTRDSYVSALRLVRLDDASGSVTAPLTT